VCWRPRGRTSPPPWVGCLTTAAAARRQGARRCQGRPSYRARAAPLMVWRPWQWMTDANPTLSRSGRSSDENVRSNRCSGMPNFRKVDKLTPVARFRRPDIDPVLAQGPAVDSLSCEQPAPDWANLHPPGPLCARRKLRLAVMLLQCCTLCSSARDLAIFALFSSQHRVHQGFCSRVKNYVGA
jgi:hypothetical protein